MGFEDYLLKNGRAKLQKCKCYDFLKIVQSDFDFAEVEKVLDKFRPPITEEEFLLLCYRFREAPAHLEEHCKQISTLKTEIDKHRQEVEVVAKELFVTDAIKEGKNDHIYREMFQRFFKKQKINLHDGWDRLRKEGKIDQKYDAFRKGYYRWCKKTPRPTRRNKNWPSWEFFLFIASISVHYVVHDQAGKKEFFLLDRPDTVPQLNQIWRIALNLLCTPNDADEKKQVEKIQAASNLTVEEKKAKLQRLATHSNLSAIQRLLESEGNSNELTLRAAMLKPSEYGKKRQWQGDFCPLPQLVPYHHFKTICLRNMEWNLGGKVIPAKAIVKQISFSVDAQSEEWHQSVFSKRQLKSSPYSDGYNTLATKECNIGKPSPDDFDEMMKIGNIISSIEFVFANGDKLYCYNRAKTILHISEEQYTIHALHKLIGKLKDADNEALPSEVRKGLNSLVDEVNKKVQDLSKEDGSK